MRGRGARGEGRGGGDEEEEEEEGWRFTSISECEVDPDSGFICCLETKLTILVHGDIFSPRLKRFISVLPGRK